MDSEIHIESKGKDSKPMPFPTSVYISSNRDNAIDIPGDDRRFSIIELTDKKFNEVNHSNKIDELISEENIRSLGYFLVNRKISRDMSKPFKSKYFQEIRSSSLNDWQAHVINTWIPNQVVGETYSYKKLQSDMKLYFDSGVYIPGRQKIKDLADKFPELMKIKMSGSDWKILILKSNAVVPTIQTQPLPNI